MRTSLFFAVALVCLVIQAADITPLDVKTGQWEMTTSGAVMGLPQLPPETLAKMPPEQRARMEAMMKGQTSKPTVNKQCVTKEDLANPAWTKRANESCKYTVITSNKHQQELRVDCERNGGKQTGSFKEVGTIKIEALNSETIKGTMQIKSATPGRGINMDSTFNGRWLAPVCVKDKE